MACAPARVVALGAGLCSRPRTRGLRRESHGELDAGTTVEPSRGLQSVGGTPKCSSPIRTQRLRRHGRPRPVPLRPLLVSKIGNEVSRGRPKADGRCPQITNRPRNFDLLNTQVLTEIPSIENSRCPASAVPGGNAPQGQRTINWSLLSRRPQSPLPTEHSPIVAFYRSPKLIHASPSQVGRHRE